MKDQVEREIMSALVSFQKGSRDLLSTVSIRPATEPEIEWTEVLPFQKAAEDAELFLREGRYDFAFDRIHTAFSDYVKHILTKHDVYFEADDSLSSLFTKLHDYYSSCIRLSDYGDKIKPIFLSAGEGWDMIYELRNTDIVAHPDGNMIGKREVQLAIGMANSIVDYIDDIEKELTYE